MTMRSAFSSMQMQRNLPVRDRGDCGVLQRTSNAVEGRLCPQFRHCHKNQSQEHYNRTRDSNCAGGTHARRSARLRSRLARFRHRPGEKGESFQIQTHHSLRSEVRNRGYVATSNRRCAFHDFIFQSANTQLALPSFSQCLNPL